MKTLPGLFASLLCLTAVPAAAQTDLQLSATGTSSVAPDQMVASLTVQVTKSTASAAQAGVNNLMAKALAAARAVSGMTATTANYDVETTDPGQSGNQPDFVASQNLNLSINAPNGAPPDAFNALVGDLQRDGLLLNNLDGALSASGQKAAGDAAITDAIAQIRAQAATVAAALGDEVGAIKTLSINMQAPGPVMPGRMMAMAAPATPPQAAPGPVTVSANINADITLTPKP